jgi:hypothetical protein|tara:strand:+ start:667 stop:801 length:135 start_codon:yes stop_codon:yes gene_type:complete
MISVLAEHLSYLLRPRLQHRAKAVEPASAARRHCVTLAISQIYH